MTHTRTKSLLYIVGNFVIGANLFLIGLVIFWLLQPPRVSTVEIPIEILNTNNEIAVGERIEMRIQVDKPVNTDQVTNSSVTVTCNDGNLITLTSIVRNLPEGKSTVDNSDYLLPPKALVGTDCQFVFRITYRVNPIKSVTEEWQSETFKVVER